ncbi:MAG: aspartate/glutamate racemase family protein [Pseudomonadota bacterium]|nr:aspartate/glutamate racemase family protein [Pseudomonadota bacterium]
MYCTRGKIGVIVPSLNNTLEPEFNRMAPPDIAIYATRLRLESGVPDNLRAMADLTEHASELLCHADVDVIAYCCTTGSLIDGVDWDERLAARLRDAAGLPVTTTASAAIAALKALSIKSVSVATPYVEEVNKIERAYIEARGIQVINIAGLQFTRGEELHSLDQTAARDFCRSSMDKLADGLFISCTDFASIDFAGELEQELGKPVVTSNTATLWSALRLLNQDHAIDGYGRLLSESAMAR